MYTLHTSHESTDFIVNDCTFAGVAPCVVYREQVNTSILLQFYTDGSS